MSLIAYAAYSKNEEIRYNSSSGGIFSELANYILTINGYVAGAAFDDDYKSVTHIIINDKKDISKITTSKYLQSKFHIHKEIEDKLKNGKTVLCCGTPCQIAGLKSYLKEDYSNLYTVDFICHGTPLQKIWKKYLDFQEEKNQDKVSHVNFRSKENGWNNFHLTFLFESGKKHSQIFDKDPYMQLFLNNFSLNKGCFECKFKGANRKSDITLGDFWGIDEELPEMNDNKGVSVVTVNTQKGKELFDEIKNNLTYCEIEENRAFKHNFCAEYSVEKPINYECFTDDIDKLPFEILAKKYIPKQTFKQKLKKFRVIKLLIKIKNKF